LHQTGKENIYLNITLLPIKSYLVKKLNFIFYLLFIPFAYAVAQKKVDLDPFRFTVKYRSIPNMKIDSTYRTYNVVVSGTNLMKSFLANMSPDKSVLLEGWKKLPEGGHITILVNLDDLLPESIVVKERTETIKDRTGQITGNRVYYHQEVKYSFAAKAIINDYKGTHITDFDLEERGNKQFYNSPEFAIKPLAQGYFALNTVKITAELYRQCVNRAIENLSELITDNFGFREVSSNDLMWIVDSRKHPEYEAHRRAYQQLNEVFFNMNASSSITALRDQVQPVIDYFESIKKNYSNFSKHDRKIRYASFYNLAVLYYYLDDPDNMMKEAQGLRLNDYKSGDADGFEKTALWLKNLFKTTNIYSRHFNINTENFKGPFEKESISIK
jgi:hypothetical protein